MHSLPTDPILLPIKAIKAVCHFKFSFSYFSVITNLILTLEDDMPELVCRVLSDILVGTYFLIIYLVAVTSIERYIFFCQPFKYNRIVSCRRVLLLIAVMASIVSIWMIIPEIYIGRVPLYASLYCPLNSSKVRKTYIAFCLVPTGFAVLFSCFRIRILMKKKQQQITSSGMPQFMSSSQIMSINKPAKSALHIIFFLSSLLFVTHLPTSIVNNILLQSGITWQQIDARVPLSYAVAVRVVSLLKGVISPALSPLLLLYLNKPMQKRFLSLFRS